jgi:hypothetical protein
MPRKAKPPIKNMGASVRSRLLNLSKERRQPFQLLLTHYVLERLLYRLSQTKHRDRFILKGPLLLTKWFDDPSRPTRDVDFLGFGSDDETEMINIFREVCAVSCNDAWCWTLTVSPSSAFVKETEYGGLRITVKATVDGDAALKCRARSVRCEGEGSDRAAAVVNRNCEPVTDAE